VQLIIVWSAPGKSQRNVKNLIKVKHVERKIWPELSKRGLMDSAAFYAIRPRCPWRDIGLKFIHLAASQGDQIFHPTYIWVCFGCSVKITEVAHFLVYLKKVFNPSGVVLFPSSHHNYKLQFFDFRCWWLSSSLPEWVGIMSLIVPSSIRSSAPS
jgi:hypothetical protein